MAKNESDLFNFFSKQEFWKFFIEKCFILFINFKLLVFHYNIVEISDILNKWSMWTTCIQTIYPIEFCIFCIYDGKKMKILDFFKTNA